MKTIKLAIVVAIVSGVGFGLYYLLRKPANSGPLTLVFEVSRRTIRDTVIERGSMESQNTVEGKCRLPGESKIIFIVAEGARVKKGDEVVRLDSERLDKSIDEKKVSVNEAERKVEETQQEIEVQKNKNESEISTADFELTQARLNLEKYRDGDFKAEVADFERNISEGEAELEKNMDQLASWRDLVKKGYRSPEQLREIELRVNGARHAVERDKQKLNVLKKYDHVKKITEFEHKVADGIRQLERANSTAVAETKKKEAQFSRAKIALGLAQEEFKQLEEKKGNCVICAPQNGTVAYANKPWFDADRRIREGTMVWNDRAIFYLPDMDNMQVAVNMHESVVNKVEKGHKAKIRVDAFPDVVFEGTVLRVSQLANSSWFGSTQNYQAVVTIDSIPEGVSLKPGMTAEVEVLVGTYKDIIAAPVNSVTEHFGQSYVYVQKGSAFERVQVKVGRVTNSFVEIKQGVAEDDKLALDAYKRGLEDFGDKEKQALDQEEAPAIPEPPPQTPQQQ